MGCGPHWVRVVVIGLLGGIMLGGWARADDTVAEEVAPGSIERSETDTPSEDGGQTVALEVSAGSLGDTAEDLGTPTLSELIALRLEESQALLEHAGTALAATESGSKSRERVQAEQATMLTRQRDELMKLDHALLETLAANPDPQSGPHGEVKELRGELFNVLRRIDYAVITLDSEASSVFDLENETKSALTPPTVFTTMVDTPWGGQTQAEKGERNEWENDGEISYGGGHATNAENDYVRLSLSETLSTPSGNEFGFYQDYNLDHSYVNSREFAIGAEQKFDGFWWDGDLKLTEEFGLYRDLDDPLNDRQDGLFKLRFDPEWSEGRWKADLDYKYNIKEYETFSERSNIQHSGKLRLQRKFSTDLTGDVTARYDNYNYSIGSTRGNRKYGVGTSWQYQATNDLKLNAAITQEHKSNNVRKTRDYDQLRYDAGARYSPDDDSTLEVKATLTEYEREFDPEENYQDSQWTANYRRNLSSKVDIDLRMVERAKDFSADPVDNLDTHGRSASVNYNPTENWNMRLALDTNEYEYMNIDRSYDTVSLNFATSHSWEEWRLGFDWRRDENSYVTDSNRDYVRDDMNIDLDYSLEDHRWRVYYGVGHTDQADPASVNDYTETRIGAGWDYSLDPDTDLSLSYDASRRDYDAQETQEDARFEARLSFKF